MLIERSAPGKVILCGEHSVVYGEPAIAAPVSTLRAIATIAATETALKRGLRLIAADLEESLYLGEAPATHPLAAIVRQVLNHLGGPPAPNAILTVRSALPIAGGLGSGAAISVAAAHALAAYLGHELSPETVSALAYEVERLHHGTPSGIDNTVIAHERPVYFVKGSAPELFTIAAPFTLLIANSGIAASTREAVAGVRRRYEAAPTEYVARFARMGALAQAAREALTQGQWATLGPLLDENHALLQAIGVSLPALDRLVEAARQAGALGAKLTGAGGGGNVIALVTPETAGEVCLALEKAGAHQVWQTTVG